MKSKKVLVVVLVLTLAMLATMLGACGNDGGSESNTNEPASTTADTSGAENPEAFKIGFPFLTTSTDPTMVSVVTNVKAAVESAGGELVVVESDLTADTLINNVTDLISQGVDGIMFMPASDSMLPTVNQMCADAGVYWSTMFRVINDEAIKEEIHNSEFFAGSVNEDDTVCAYDITKSMADQGVKNLCVINIAKGDTSSDLRDNGIEKAVAETGINLLNTTYNITTQDDMTKTIETYLAAYPEMDGIMVAGTYCPAALPTIEKALADHKVSGEIKVGRIDFEATMGEYLKEGTFHVAYGGQQQIDPLLATAILVNRVVGTPIKDDGPTVLVTNYLPLTTAEEADNFMEYFLGDEPVFTPDEIKDEMIKFYDNAIDENTFLQIIDDFSVADVVARHS
jgi:ABC-type sugar transport system substrate-binding protein